MHFNTKVIHAGISPDSATGAIMTPIYQTTTYVQDAPGKHKGYDYARGNNPTRTALQNNLAALENSKYGLCFSTGMGAIDAVIKLLKPGDHVIATSDLYGGSYRIFKHIFEPYGIEFSFIDLTDLEEVQKHINKNTKLIWAETPTNPTLSIIDIKACADLAHDNDALLVTDNTFASPALQNPIDLGADIVMHSVTKYIGGHSDVVLGALCLNDESLYTKLKFIQNTSGATPGPQDCFLALRGIKTLHLRMERHCQNGEKIAHFLASHPKVSLVNWPGFKTHPGHEIALNQMKGFGGMMSFDLKQDSIQNAHQFLKQTKLFSLAESLGGVESLAGHPASMTHGSLPKKQRLENGITDSLIRLSVGIEHVDDLIADLDQALNSI
jgi:cystathionine beta-lyase